jgi:hypothetical protein
MPGALVFAGLLIALGLCATTFALLTIARSLNGVVEQLRLGVRVTETIPPAAIDTEPQPGGVASWPSAEGWPSTPPHADDDSPELRGRRGGAALV